MKKFIFFLWISVYLTVGGTIAHFDGTGVSFWMNAFGMCSALLIGIFIGFRYEPEKKDDCLSD